MNRPVKSCRYRSPFRVRSTHSATPATSKVKATIKSFVRPGMGGAANTRESRIISKPEAAGSASAGALDSGEHLVGLAAEGRSGDVHPGWQLEVESR